MFEIVIVSDKLFVNHEYVLNFIYLNWRRCLILIVFKNAKKINKRGRTTEGLASGKQLFESS